MRRHTLLKFLIIILLIAVLFVLNLLLGTVRIPVGNVVSILFGGDGGSEVWKNIIISSRVPQALTATVAGAGLAVSGLQMQTVFRNPLAGPSVLGISNGASLGV
ncbi:MAG: iron chelate uptake ABC transporter family permease subunit, partial [Bacteroidaceae bacterium]